MASFPWDQAVTFKPGFALPAFTGMDLGSGKRDVNLGDFANVYQNAPPVFSGNTLPTNYAAPEQPGAYQTGSPLGNLSQSYGELLDYQKARMPLDLAYQQQVADITTAQQNKQLASLYPYLSQAGTEATQRALAASKAYRAFAEGLPSNVQNIMASKQNQAYSAAQGEAARAQATALQQQAANQSFGAFRGREISFG
jgi:flagellar hook-basal body complex protein FliE